MLAAPPLAGLFRLGGQATRGRDVNLSDAIDPCARRRPRSCSPGRRSRLAVLVLATNVVTGLLVGGILPWMVSTAAAWGLLATLVLGFAYWPLAVDPARAGMRAARPGPAGRRCSPSRIPCGSGALTLVLALILAASTVVFAALVTVSVALCAFIACRYVLPAADRLEAQLAAAARHGRRLDGEPTLTGLPR